MRRARLGTLACAVAAVSFLAVGCGGGTSSTPSQAQAAGSGGSAATTAPATTATTATTVAGPSNVIISEKDFAIQAPVATAKAGVVTFDVANQGPSAHEFLVFKTDLSADKLPVGPDGRVNEDALNKVFDSQNNIDPNGAKTFNPTLAPGHYVLVCNLAPNHYMAGMRADFTVSA
jgi:uncharacterized cupredoxin-like copper-binding protein